MLNSSREIGPATLTIAEAPRPRLSVLWPIACAASLLYGSLIPFEINWASFGGLLPGGLLGAGLDSTSVEDVITNVLLYVPIGLLVVLAHSTRKPSALWRLSLAVLAGAAVSLVAENLQAGETMRVASWLDVGLNTFGALTGAVLALTFHGAEARWGRSLRDRLSRRPCSTLALILTVGLLFYGLAPFDFVTNTQGLHASFLHARWSLALTQPGITSELVGVLWYALVGCLHALGCREARRSPITAWLGAMKTGLLLAGLVEVMQLFVASHCFELHVVVLRGVAVAVGAWVGAFLMSSVFLSGLRDRPTTAISGGWWTLLLLVQLLAVLADSMGSTWPTLARLDLSAVRWMPFEALWHRSALAAVSSGLEVIATYVVLGLTLAGMFRCFRWRSVWPLTGLAVLFVASAAEGIELSTAGGTPDITGPTLALASVLLLAQLSQWWRFSATPQGVAG